MLLPNMSNGLMRPKALVDGVHMNSIQKWTIALTLVAAGAPAWAGSPVPVPEPGTFGLMTVGVVALVVASLRKRK